MRKLYDDARTLQKSGKLVPAHRRRSRVTLDAPNPYRNYGTGPDVGPGEVLLPRHRQLEAFLRGNHVIVIVLFQVDLDPVHLAAELIVSSVVVR
jgi:hypothetical protein